jgi:hypothetical protein
MGTLTLMNSTVSGNSAHYCGGGICNWSSGSAQVINSTVTGNYSDNRGGGIGNRQGTLTVKNSTVSGNSSLYYGGGVWNYWSNVAVSVTDSTVNGNHTGDPNFPSSYSAGGGIYNEGPLFTLRSTTVSGNSSDGDGGGIADNGVLTVVSATITNNRADFDNNGVGAGGGLFFESYFWVDPILRNTIVAGNYRGPAFGTASDIDRHPDHSLDASSSFNLIGNGGSGGLADGVNSNQVGVASPGLSPLQNNGGPTETHSLLPEAPPSTGAITSGSSQTSAASRAHTTIRRSPTRRVETARTLARSKCKSRRLRLHLHQPRRQHPLLRRRLT